MPHAGWLAGLQLGVRSGGGWRSCRIGVPAQPAEDEEHPHAAMEMRDCLRGKRGAATADPPPPPPAPQTLDVTTLQADQDRMQTDPSQYRSGQ